MGISPCSTGWWFAKGDNKIGLRDTSPEGAEYISRGNAPGNSRYNIPPALKGRNISARGNALGARNTTTRPALKGRNISARGNAPGTRGTTQQALKGRNNTPNITPPQMPPSFPPHNTPHGQPCIPPQMPPVPYRYNYCPLLSPKDYKSFAIPPHLYRPYN